MYRTDVFQRGSHNRAPPTRSHASAGAYSTLSVETRDSPLNFQETFSLNRTHSNSSEQLIDSDSVDGRMQQQSMSTTALPKAYEVPTASQENLSSAGLDSTSCTFEAINQRSSSTSRYNSNTCPFQAIGVQCHPHSSPANDGRSARNPWNDYEDTFSPNSSLSFRDSPTIPDRVRRPESQWTRGTANTSFDRVRGNDSPRGSTGSQSPQVMKQTLMAQFQSTDNIVDRRTRESTFSEPPPPYSPKLSSQAASITSSMIVNTAYESTDHSQQQQSNTSADSRFVRSTHTPSGMNTSNREIHPYAMIHNEHIPYNPHNTRSNGVAPNTSSFPISGEVDTVTNPTPP